MSLWMLRLSIQGNVISFQLFKSTFLLYFSVPLLTLFCFIISISFIRIPIFFQFVSRIFVTALRVFTMAAFESLPDNPSIQFTLLATIGYHFSFNF